MPQLPTDSRDDLDREQRWEVGAVGTSGDFSWDGRDRGLGCITAPPAERCCPSTWHGGSPWWGSTLRKGALPPPTVITTHAQCQAQDHEQPTLGRGGLAEPHSVLLPWELPSLVPGTPESVGGVTQMKRTPLSSLSTICIFLFHLYRDHVQQLMFYPHCLQMKNWMLRKVKTFPQTENGRAGWRPRRIYPELSSHPSMTYLRIKSSVNLTLDILIFS